MRKLFKILLCSLGLFFIFLKATPFVYATMDCVVIHTSDTSNCSSTNNLRLFIECELNDSAAQCNYAGSTIDPSTSYFDQFLYVKNTRLGYSSSLSTIQMSSSYSVNLYENTVFGNPSYDAASDENEQVGYSSSYPNSFVVSGTGEEKNYGTATIDARSLESDEPIFTCSSDTKILFIRNAVFLTNQEPTQAVLMEEDCEGDILNAGWAWLCQATEVSDPSSDPNCVAINDLTAATEEGTDADGDTFDSEESGGDDCDDTDATINPDATEICDDVDNDCDGQVDEKLSDCEEETNVENSAALCEDGADNDGDSYIDADDSECVEFYDNDEDGYCESDTECVDSDGDGTDEIYGDCDDNEAVANPGYDEICDDIDNNCDGEEDEGCEDSCYDENGDVDCVACPELDECAAAEDADGDGYTTTDDCDDADSTINPGAAEICDDTDEVDEDCDGDSNDDDSDCSTDSGDDIDDDGDTFTENEGDCDDDPTTGVDVYPGATETYNQVDDDCDGTVDNGYAGDPTVDDDLDGYCEDDTSCSDGMDPGDCDDTDDTVYPNATEICEDGIDNDCDGYDVIDDTETLSLKKSTLYRFQSSLSKVDVVNASESGLTCEVSADIPSGGGCGCDILGARQANPVNSVLLMILLAMPVGLVMVVRRSPRRGPFGADRPEGAPLGLIANRRNKKF